MNWNIQWEPLAGMQAHEQVSKLVEDLLRNSDKNSKLETKMETWLPVVDLSKLRPN
jgi:predicted outer membrane protein